MYKIPSVKSLKRKKKIKLGGVKRCASQRERARRQQLKAYWLKRGKGCIYCGVKLTEENMTVDHVVPRSKDGSENAENLAPCCISCNRKKGNSLNWKAE